MVVCVVRQRKKLRPCCSVLDREKGVKRFAPVKTLRKRRVARARSPRRSASFASTKEWRVGSVGVSCGVLLWARAMATPARRRLMRDFKRLQEDPPQGVTGAPVEEQDDIMKWNAVIFG